ncbi:MAG: helix-turn-helix domain-containing protein [Clostridiales bacterium]|nr:helix-turn-helix domain-containing protein [Clostridiales bacterium]
MQAEIKENISGIIKYLLEQYNLSQEQLAKSLDVSQKAISNWINKIDCPKASSMLLIYEKYGITPNQLLNIDPIV